MLYWDILYCAHAQSWPLFYSFSTHTCTDTLKNTHQLRAAHVNMSPLWKMTMFYIVTRGGRCWLVVPGRQVNVIRISLWLTRWDGRSLKSQGSRLKRPPSDTSPHFTGTTSLYDWPCPLFSLASFCLLAHFWGLSERWKMACSWPSTSFPLGGGTSSLCWQRPSHLH